MNVLDYAVLGIFAVSLLIGVWRGAIREIVNVMGWVIAFIAAQAFAPEFGVYLSDWMTDPSVRVVVAWLIIFIAVMMGISLAGSLIAEGVRKLGLGPQDRSLGAVVGLLRGGLIVLLLTLAAGLTTFPNATIWKDAALTPWLETMALCARPLLPESLARRIAYGRVKSRQALMWLQPKG